MQIPWYSCSVSAIEWDYFINLESEIDLSYSSNPTNPLTGENRSYGIHQGVYGIGVFLKDVSHVCCDTVWKLAVPRTLTLCATASELATLLALDLESSLLNAAFVKQFDYHARDKMQGDDQLSKWANDIFDWTDYSTSTESTSSCHGLKLMPSAYVSTHASFKNLRPKDCRLILPIISSDLNVSEDTGDLEDLSRLDDEYSNNVDDVNSPNDIAQATFGMFSLNNGVERQQPPASQHIVANAAIS
ncbi:hypothetical protein GGI21_002526, partial [Coemansia aciculifera]